jgi:hypothetical protein
MGWEWATVSVSASLLVSGSVSGSLPASASAWVLLPESASPQGLASVSA